MTAAGFIVMLLSVGSVTLLFGWCVRKVLITPDEAGKMHGAEGHTPDCDEE